VNVVEHRRHHRRNGVRHVAQANNAGGPVSVVTRGALETLLPIGGCAPQARYPTGGAARQEHIFLEKCIHPNRSCCLPPTGHWS
jgi:hypothetical protein